MKFEYYYKEESEQFTFFRIPKILMTSPQFKGISDGAKLLYGMMLDRMGLSLRNGWLDEQGRAYIFFTVDEVRDVMGCAVGKAVKMLAELDSVKGVGLIERRKRGQGRPSVIYVKKLVSEDNPRSYPTKRIDNSSDNRKSGGQNFTKENSALVKNEIAENRKSECNNTDVNYTELNNINLSHQHNEVKADSTAPKTTGGWIDRYSKNVEDIKNNIAYETLCITHDSGTVMNCIHIMAEVLTVDAESYEIEGKHYPAELVRMRLRNVNFAMMDSFLMHFERRTTPIANMKKYLITSLFNIPSTSAAQLRNTVVHDMYGRSG